MYRDRYQPPKSSLDYQQPAQGRFTGFRALAIAIVVACILAELLKWL